MSEKEIIEQLQSELVLQVEEKVKMIQWSQLLFSDIAEQLDEHFNRPTNNSKG